MSDELRHSTEIQSVFDAQIGQVAKPDRLNPASKFDQLRRASRHKKTWQDALQLVSNRFRIHRIEITPELIAPSGTGQVGHPALVF